MNSQVLPCSENAFDALAPEVRKWVWKQGWSSLRKIQCEAIPYLLSGGDAIISAATAGGKTEAAFLPLLSRVSTEGVHGSFDIIYISPLKALINDQYQRLESLCETLDLPVTKWHGDVSASIKQKALKNPGGVLLITPESLESLLMRKGLQIPRLFGQSLAIVIDELHAFMGTERGVQLRSVINRIEVLTGKKVDRVGLSATLGDLSMAAQFLRSNANSPIPIITGEVGETDLKLQLRSYIEKSPNHGDAQSPSAKDQIAGHAFKAIRGGKNLVFAGSKKNVELYGATLRDLCTANNFPNEFFTHHANISKPDREALESRLKNGQLPTTAVCTSTLELGIDIGDVETVVQIGCSGSVAALRQRMGRSGRRAGASAILRAYNLSSDLSSKSHMIDFLRPHLIQAIAEIELLLEGCYEPPAPHRLHFSTFVHQILALIVERGGAIAKKLYGTLCRTAPFENITPGTFKDILRAMGQQGSDLIEQAPDGTLLLGSMGEILTSHYSFYAVFETQEEFRIICKGKELGTLPITGATTEGMLIIFSGRRWKILHVYVDDKVIEVSPAKGGTPPKFEGNGPSRHKIVENKMLEIYTSDDHYKYLDKTASDLLIEARSSFQHQNLKDNFILSYGDGVILFPWAGSIMIDTLAIIFQHKGYTIENEDYALSIKGISDSEAFSHIIQLSKGDIPDREKIAWAVKNKSMGQYDHFLTDELLVQQLASIMPNDQEIQCWAKSRIKCSNFSS